MDILFNYLFLGGPDYLLGFQHLLFTEPKKAQSLLSLVNTYMSRMMKISLKPNIMIDIYCRNIYIFFILGIQSTKLLLATGAFFTVL